MHASPLKAPALASMKWGSDGEPISSSPSITNLMLQGSSPSTAITASSAASRLARLCAQPREFGHAFVKVLLDVVIDLSQGVVHRTNDGRVSNLKTLVCAMLTRLYRGNAERA